MCTHIRIYIQQKTHTQTNSQKHAHGHTHIHTGTHEDKGLHGRRESVRVKLLSAPSPAFFLEGKTNRSGNQREKRKSMNYANEVGESQEVKVRRESVSVNGCPSWSGLSFLYPLLLICCLSKHAGEVLGGRRGSFPRAGDHESAGWTECQSWERRDMDSVYF